MLAYDDSGRVRRANAAFEALVGGLPPTLAALAPEWQALLGWSSGARLPELVVGGPAVERLALVTLAGGRRHRLTARLGCVRGEDGRPRVLAVLEDRSAEEERDRAQLEISMLMDTASVGVATFDPSRGWLAPSPVAAGAASRTGAGPGATSSPGSSELLSIGRERVEPDSLPEYERLQQALRQGLRTEARYAVRHPQLGLRWLLTRVEPIASAAAPATLSVVTLDVTDRERAQHRNEALLRDRELMFNLSEVGIIYLRGARIERANEAMARLSGYSVAELSMLEPRELYKDARECVDFETQLAQALHEAGRFVGERRLRRRDGSLCWVQVSARPVARGQLPAEIETDTASPEAAGVICSFVDVDERHRARDALAQQAERTRAILNSVLVGIVTVDEDGIEWMNPSARRMFAGELADFVGQPVATVATTQPDHPLRRTDWWQRLADGQSENFECRLRGRDGREFWVVGNAVASDGDGASRQLTFALLDIDRRRQAEIRSAQAQEALQRVIETAPMAIALFDAQTLRVQQLNQVAAGYFGRPDFEAVGATPVQLLGEDGGACQERWLRSTADTGVAAQHDWQDSDAASGPRVWDVRIAPLEPAAGGTPDQLLLVAADVTEQRQAEQARLQAAIAQREALVREVHHRIKNNLQGVAGLLRQNAERHPEVAVVLTEAVGQVQAIAQVYGLQVGARGPLGVAPLLQAIAQSVHRTYGREIQVDASTVPHLLPETEAIPVALTLNELLTNAIKHGEGGAVLAVARLEGEGVSLRIASRARLAEGFELAKVRAGVSGLGLVRALLPRRSATLALEQVGDEVVATVSLRPPSVQIAASPNTPPSAPPNVPPGAASTPPP